MMRFTDLRSASLFLAAGFVIAACGDDDPGTDTSSSSTSTGTTSASVGSGTATSTSAVASSGATASASSGSGTGGGGSCLDEHAAGDRYSAGDDCNFCDCNADGSTTCTTRTCPGSAGCTYDGVDHAYGERFPSTDACNECVCAASGLACTRRDCTVMEEGAILVESLDTPCGTDPTFTAKNVLNDLPFDDLVAPFAYVRDRELYPETLPDTTVRVRVVYDGGFAVCRIPNPGQEAFDIEVLVEWMTADGAFDEGFHTYLRRNAGGFTDAWYIAAGAPPGGLDGTYDPACLDASGFGFDATINADATAEGHVVKICETDILLDVGVFTHP